MPEQAARQEENHLHTNPFLKWGSLVVLSLALAIIIIDTTLLNVSLTTIIKELNTDIQSIQWVITSYSLTLAALTITGGRLGDLFGRKRMFILGAIIFAVGSFIASIANSIPVLLLGESLVEGIGAALMMPATSSLLVSSFHGRERALAFGVWGGVAAAASAVGPILGGYLTKYYSWRWGFRINVFVVLLLVLGSVIVKEAYSRNDKAKLDFVGVVLSSLGMLGVVFGIIESSLYGWLSAKKVPDWGGFNWSLPLDMSIVVPSIVLGVLFLALFVVWELYIEERGDVPLVSMQIFKNRQFTAGVITTAIFSLAMTGLIFVLPVFLQVVRGLDAFETGMALLPLSLTILIVAPFSAFLSTKFSPKLLIQIGILLNMAAIFVLRESLTVDTQPGDLIPGLVLYGGGIGMVMAQISNITLSALPVAQAGEASGINNTLRQVGSTLGSALIGAALLTGITTNFQQLVTDSQIIPQQLKVTINEGVAEQSSNIEFNGGPAGSSELPEAIVAELQTISHKAIVEANKGSLLYTFGFALLGFVFTFLLPVMKPHGHKQGSLAGGH